MSINARLGRLAPTLSPRERFLLMLRAHAAGQEPDPEWRRLTTLAERREYDGYVALCVAANNELGMVLYAIAMITSDLESRLATSELLVEAAQLIEADNGLAPPARPVRRWRQQQGEITAPTFLRGVSQEIRDSLRSDVSLRWQELRGLEIVWAEIATDLDDVDHRDPELVSLASQTGERLLAIFHQVAKQRRPSEPSEEIVEDMHKRVDKAFSLFGLKEPQVSIDARLKQVSPLLTARERAILVLRSLKEKTPEDRSWRSTMPREQAPEFNRLIVLMNACNIHLPLYITMVEQHTERLYLRFMWLDTLIGSGSQVWKLAQLIPASKRRQAERVVAGSYPLAELPWDPEEHENSWLNVAEGMERAIRVDLASLWEDLGALDIVLAEVATEFDGEDPLRPVMRGIVETTRKKLTNLHEVLSSQRPLELNPGEEALDLARTYFENGKRLMHSL